MSKYLIEDTTLTGIADALREKTGTTDTIAVTDMAAQIIGMKTGSPNGTEWTPVSNITSSVNKIRSGQGKYMAATGAGLYASTDGKTWELILSGAFQALEYGFGLWVASYGNGQIIYSTDGVTWTNGSKFDYGFTDISYGNNMWTAVSYYAGIYYSTNGISWTLAYSVVGCQELSYGNGMWYANNDNGESMYRSTNGTSWTKVSILSSDMSFMHVAFGGKIWLASRESLYRSLDGLSWTSAGFSNFCKSSDYGNGLWVAGTYSNGQGIHYSADCATWTQASIPASSSAGAWRVKYANGVWIAGDTRAREGIFYSLDGKTWLSTNVTTLNASNIFYENGIWLAGGSPASGSSSLYYSVAWEPS